MNKHEKHGGRQDATGAVRNSAKALRWGLKVLVDVLSWAWGLALDLWYWILDLMGWVVSG
jgi:hypothetical protein